VSAESSKPGLGELITFVEGRSMSADLEVFHFEEGHPSFESYGHQNGFRHWLASDLVTLLDYMSMQPILNAVNKAMAACAHLNIPIPENFIETKTANGGRDWKLSRFACYLTVMNGDPKKPRVAAAQAYFITMAEAFRQHVQEAENVERVVVRAEVSEREKALSGTVYARGVQNYAFFQNAGYRGLYNLDMNHVRRLKGVPSGRSLLDFMGKTELAANLFRITQTEEKIRNEDISGQHPLERAAESVGKAVRKTMIEISGTPPERLPAAQDISEVKKSLKRTGKEYAKLDAPKKPASRKG
jgi:DNA-damage-inducible protein D